MAVIAVAWLAAPSWLDSRFFIWLAPAASFAAGVGVASRPRLVWLAVACVAVQLVAVVPNLGKSEVPNRIAAGFVRASQGQGVSVCALGRTGSGLLAYVRDVRAVRDSTELSACEVAVEAAGPRKQPLMGAACERFAVVLGLPARYPGAVFSDRPLPIPPEFVAEAPPDAPHWEQTRSSARCTAVLPRPSAA